MLWKKAHFIGIGGVGMSAVAKLLKDARALVTGSDEEVYEPVKSYLAQEGLLCKAPYNPHNIPEDADIIVIGKNAKLVPEENEEVAAAYKSGKTILSYPEVLAEISKNKEVVVVAGSYGKSTSAALLAHVLEHAGLLPSYFIGAVPVGMPNAKMGAGKLFVMEGDEYPSSNTDPRAKFLHYHPKHLLITPLAHDHLNIFPTPEDYLKPFEELVALTPDVVICTEGPLSQKIVQKIKTPVTYGLASGNYTATNIVWGERTTCEIKGITIETSLLGEHNIQNIVGVAAFVLEHKLMSPEQFAAGVASFRGVVRRLDRKSDKTAVPIFEGFGSSYEKLRSAIAAMKLHFPKRRLIVVFEPHTFSWRNREALPWYDTAFVGASKVFIYEPATQGAQTHAQLSKEEILERVRAAGFEAEDAELAAIERALDKDDCILLSTSGAMGGLIESIPHLAEQKFPSGAVVKV